VRRAPLWCALAAVLTACGVPAEGAPRFRDEADVPFGLLERTTATTTTTTAATEPGGGPPVCLLSDEVIRTVPRGTAGSLLERLREVPTEEEEAAGLRTALPDPEIVASVVMRGGVAQVELRDDLLDLAGRLQRFAIAQVVCTATATPGIGQVRFRLGDTSLPVPRGDGTLTDVAVALDDYASLLATP